MELKLLRKLYAFGPDPTHDKLHFIYSNNILINTSTIGDGTYHSIMTGDHDVGCNTEGRSNNISSHKLGKSMTEL